jgi:uncharacterized membrane protein YccC
VYPGFGPLGARLVEKKVCGGLATHIGGNIAVVASGRCAVPVPVHARPLPAKREGRSDRVGGRRMTSAAAPTAPPSAPSEVDHGPLAWLRAQDPDYLVLKRSVRAAVVVSSLFAIAHFAFKNSQVGLFVAFGSFALLLLVEFTGAPRSRLVSYLGLWVVGSVLIILGTVVSTNKPVAVVMMGVVGFVVLFAGIVAPQAATASTAALLTFVLSVAVAQPASAVGWRMIGWAMAGVCCIASALLVWPPPWHDNLRRRLSTAVSAVARLADARAAGSGDLAAQEDVTTELAKLRSQFSATPYPPTGAASGAVALSKLVGRIEWLASNTAMLGDDHWSTEPAPALAVTGAVAKTLHEAAGVICDGEGHPVEDPGRITALQDAVRQLDQLTTAALDAEVSSIAESEADRSDMDRHAGEPGVTGSTNVGDAAGGDEGIAGELDPGFHARAVGIAAEMVADAALESVGADPVASRRLGMDESTANVFKHRLLSHLSFRSVWFRNALRGAIGLALAVAVVEVTNVQHGFWVVLGTLSVLRSNALGTGSSAMRAIGGTAVGFFVGAALIVGIGTHLYLLWILLPVAALVAGIAPSMISFTAGQAAFTVMVVILFNIIQPAGWRVGLTRIEDVAIGCGVSIVVGFMFWPRGATAALGRAMSNSFVASSGYLADAVDRLTMTRRHVDTSASERASQRAYFLLDDAFRQFFAERGAKVVSVETITRLFTGSNRLRTAAFILAAVRVSPPTPGLPEVESVEVAESVLRDTYAQSHHWYQEFADLLSDRPSSLDLPSPHDEVLHGVLRQAFEDVGKQGRADRVQTTLQMLWADEVLESQSQMQVDLLASANLFTRSKGALI